MKRLLSLLKPSALIGLSGLALLAASASLRADDSSVGAVYTMTNAPAGNAVLVFDRARDGSLSPAGAFATGGKGTGTGLGNQGGLVLDRSHRLLLVVNAGSDELSAFAVTHSGVQLTDTEMTGGVRPISVTVHRNLVYVLNAGSDNLTGFRIDAFGDLQSIPGSSRALSGMASDPAQVEFSPDGDVVVVTEKATSRILIYPVDDDGLLGAPTIHVSPTPTPFGFAFGKHDQFFVSEAAGGAPGASAVSSYQLHGGMASIVTVSAPTHQTAACWVVVTSNGHFAYTSNTGSGTITGFAITPDGRLRELDADGITGDTGAGSAPIDLALSRSNKFLYSLNSGNGSISAFRVGHSGELTALPTLFGLPAAANGLAAR
ncbi:MAG TPA: beta-propeller fold lactonase family protein [Casimicrobiaceae bacterium]